MDAIEFIETWVGKISAFLWTYPLSILLLGAGLFLTFRLGFFQFRFFGHALSQTAGKIFSKEKHEGTITPFQAFTSALASTAGATNIVGVAVAIAFGGPGALFWMWIVALIGMATKYSEIMLGVKYREKNEKGVWVGGPQYYIKKALGWKKVAFIFAFFLMIEAIPSLMVQTNSITTQVNTAYGWSTYVTGGIMCVLVAIVVLGGIQRIAKVTDKFVPFMVLSYLLIALIIIGMHANQLPNVFGLIFAHAFNPIAATGGFGGAALAQALRWGIARGLYSNEAGLGTAPITHAAAQTDHPSRQGLWGIFSVFVDTIVICTITGLTVLVTGAWKEVGTSEASNMVSIAFGTLMGEQVGAGFIAIYLFFFVITTIGVLIFFAEKQAEYLFGLKFSKIMRVLYIFSIFIGAIGGLEFVWQFLDILLAFVLVANIIPILALNKEIKAMTKDYIERVYKRKKGDPSITLFSDDQSMN